MIIIINDQPLVSSYILYKLIFAKFHSNLLDLKFTLVLKYF